MEAKATPMISRLKMIRRELGLTQRGFAERTGIAYGSVFRMEQGQNNITDRTIKIVCERCKVREQWLRFGEGRMFVDAADDRRDAFESFVRVFKLTPNQQLQIAAIADYPVDTAEIYAQSAAASELDVAKRNIARLVKAIDNGKAGRAAS